ncbi:peptidase M13 [Pseudoclavibacter chungangensis]|uniref:Peptidase M13 n=1 Tax=Pseudoclavibacter chungangensis TaxID=587635 RepID=A0A7J5BP68_9MICO|nr:M13-type metalloendopeptidase [Pseudoclavibacter chungangensis]KAB1654537.1 peptidase M13 [Pseudoclavibacter chungangensis]NYJ68236.1 putative endopeptidase [Pseudoclavibacter chungangensis]
MAATRDEAGREALVSGIDRSEFDDSVRVQDDLFRHTNGGWLATAEIPPSLPAWGSFMKLRDEAEDAVRELLEEGAAAEPGTDARKAADAFAAFMDTAKLEELGIEPIRDDLAAALAVGSIDEFLRTLGRQEREGLGGFFQAFVYPDADDPTRYALSIEQGGLGLPDESYYREEQHAPIREAYLAHIERMFAIAELDGPAERARRVFELETAIASHHWDNVATRDAQKTHNPRTWAQLREAFDGIDLDGWRDELQAPAGAFDEIDLREPSFAEGLVGLLVAERLDEWRDWLLWRIVVGSAALLTPAISAANFEFYGKVLQGTQEQRERWKRGVAAAQGVVSDAIGREYVARHFPPTAKTRMEELVGHLLDAYRASITTLEWMTPATREKALDKLDRFVTKIGYPERWRDYTELEVAADDLVGNARRSAVFEAAYEYGKLGGPVRKDEWLMPPQTVNAYYSPGENEIVFPAAILQPPFFDAEADDAANYGAIGAVIGHEIGHGFDDQGSKYDGDGKLEDWWTDEDRAAFEERTASLIAQYDALSPVGADGEHVNGSLTIGENIGDLGGLGIAWKAYLATLDGAEPPVIDGLTGAERFFFAWAQAWRQTARPEYVKLLLQVDPHSPAEFRCNQIVRNIDAFHDTFGTSEGDGLWLAPEERVTIW